MAEDIEELDISFLDEQGDEEAEEELSEVDEELEEEQVFGGPTTWAEVDLVELDRVMLRVTAAAIPSTDNKEIGSRLAMQAAALEADNSDPLGLGRIDPRNLCLVRADEAKKAWRMGNMASTRRRPGKRSDAEHSNGEDSSGHKRPSFVNATNIHEMRAKALPSSESFDPEIYLGTVHKSTAMEDLLKGRQNLTNEVSERTGQLKALVKENFDRFISCKNTIDDIHKRLRQSEAHDNLSASGSSTSDMVIAISEVQDEAKRAFADLLNRASKSDQVKSVVGLLKRYEGLFQLPSRIRQCTKRGEYDHVISEYKKARTLMDGMGALNTKSVWHKLFTEVEKGVATVVQCLECKLRDPDTPQLAAIDAMRQVLQLQAENAASTRGMEPVMLYVHAREKHLRQQLEHCTEEHKEALQSMRLQDPESGHSWRPADSPSLGSNGHLKLPASAWAGVGGAAVAWVNYVRALVHIVATSLPDFWHVPQDKLNQVKAVPGALKYVQEGVDTGLAMGKEILRSFSSKLHLALRELVQEENDRSHFLSALREIITGFVSFNATNTPPFVTDCLQNILETATSLAISQMVACQKRMTARMAENEDFNIIASSHKAGHPASKIPGMLREVVAFGMQQLKAVMEEASRADTDTHAYQPIGKSGTSLRQAFFGCFTEYAVATDLLWASVSSKADYRVELSRDTKLLVLHSNCVHVRTHVLKDLSARYNDLLTVDGGFEECRELQTECAEDMRAVEARLAGIYIEARVDLLNDMLEEYFEDDGTDWVQTSLPTGLRDCAFEMINTLVAVQAEVYSYALSLQRRVLDELLQHLFAAYITCVEEKLPDLRAGGALQLLVELQYFGQALGGSLRPPRDQLVLQAKACLLSKIDQLADKDGSPDEAELEKWCDSVQGGSMSGRADMVSNFLVTELVKATHLNVASFSA